VRELRTCPVTGRVVLINDAWVDTAAAVEVEPSCWYCAQNDQPITTLGGARAVAHPVPALGIEGNAQPLLLAGAVRRQAVGAHELVFGEHAGGELLPLVARRWTDLRRDARLLGFGAVRRAAPGRHVAWQVHALPYAVPASAPAGWRDAERTHRERLLDDGAATTLLAWAPRVPFETWILPTLGIAPFERTDGALLRAVELAAEAALRRITVALRGAAVDLVIVDGEPWRIELLPRLGAPAAVEIATGVPIHGVFPEVAAAFLRDQSASISAL
jgi:hypothetical protein